MEGSRALLEKVAENVIKESNYNHEITQNWRDFLNEAPASDNAEDYVAALPCGLHIPLYDVLFLGHPVPINADAPAALMGTGL